MADNEILNIILSHIQNISKVQEGLAKTQQETALLVERLTGRLTANEDDIKAIKERPKTDRDVMSTVMQAGGCLGSVLFALLSVVSIVITVVMVIAQHWH